MSAEPILLNVGLAIELGDSRLLSLPGGSGVALGDGPVEDPAAFWPDPSILRSISPSTAAICLNIRVLTSASLLAILFNSFATESTFRFALSRVSSACLDIRFEV